MSDTLSRPVSGGDPSPKLAETRIEPTAALKRSRIGRQCEVGDHCQLNDSEMGDFSYLGPFCMLDNAVVGRFCAIAAQVRIGAPNHPMNRASMHRFTYCTDYYSSAIGRDAGFFDARREAQTRIGHDVWIGHGVIVLPGVTVGHGAVLAAGAVVTRDVAPYSLVAGMPARQLRLRFPPDIIRQLQEIAWWDWPFDTILARMADFRSEDIVAFCRRYGAEAGAS